jgi:ribosomal protein S18 acetylase RimI-like enzyme
MIRSAKISDASALAQIRINTWRSAYAGIVPAQVLAGFNYEAEAARWEENLHNQPPQNELIVAEPAPGLVVGFCGGGPNRIPVITPYTGELYAIYILPAYHGQGIGKALVAEFSRRMWQQEHRNMLVWVLEDNLPARKFYEHLGGVFVTKKPITIGGAELQEVSYGWLNIQPLTEMK